MAFVKKGAPSARSLNDPEGVAQASQRAAGNTAYDIYNPNYCYSSGVNPVNSKGQVTNKTGKVMNWPYQQHNRENMLNPEYNPVVPPVLGKSPSAIGDGGGEPRGYQATLG